MKGHRNTVDEFWRRANKEEGDGCWLWTGLCTDTGYGKFSLSGIEWKAHRLAFILTYGPVPDAMFVCHHCDTPLCVRPEHLFLGTHRDNMRDMAQKGRQGSTCFRPGNQSDVPSERRARGVRHGMARLNEQQVREIRRRSANGEMASALAREYGMVISSILNIIERRNWRHLA